MADRTPLARVSALQGKAFARDQDGNLRQLQIGDVIYEGDVVVTGAGSRIDLATPDRHSLVLRANETLTVDAEVFATVKPDATDAALVGGARDINRVIKAINEGGSLDALLDETAAGAGTPGGADGGPTFVRLLRIVETLDPLAFDFGTDRRGSVDEPLDGVGSAADALAGLVDAGLAGQSAAAAAATVGGSIPIDTAAPSVVVDIVDASLNNGDKVSTVTFTFSDAPSGFDLTDVTAVGGTLSGLAVSLTDPKVYRPLHGERRFHRHRQCQRRRRQLHQCRR
ncbi:MAG: retention module-containing protein [Candidatus Accumulibacter sp.]|uniref:Retention module-containing protein n=1 Tax=Candidatus Accumulibacter proximus TaxID=2954385 RepID=A0A935PYU9_9PROT|nr:retention module-containing protein [Candidatus Accumulibacter proximus]